METMSETKQNEPRPIFSICHTTARPAGWQESARAWVDRAAHPERIEYVLCVDERWGFDPVGQPILWGLNRWVRANLVWNTGRKCMVDGFNIAAKVSRGHILILNSDDMFPPHGWDDALLLALKGWATSGQDELHMWGTVAVPPELVIQVSSGTPADERGLMVLQIFSRARYERLGYALYPKYESLFADDDFSEHARHDDVVVDARHLVFEHRHPDWNPAIQRDAVYEHENAPEVWKRGHAIFEKRLRSGFDDDFDDVPDDDDDVEDIPIFSVVHASARPQKWREIFEAWMSQRTVAGPILHPAFRVEYILVVDERWGFSVAADGLAGPHKVVWNDQRRCCVDAWNLGAKAAKGSIIILAADDTTPPEDWDRLLSSTIYRELEKSGRYYEIPAGPAFGEALDFVPHVRTGTEALINSKSYATGLLMLSRKRYQRLGYALPPDYTGMWSDIEFWLHAEQDGVILDCTELMFPHDHPILKCKTRQEVIEGEWKRADAVYEVQNAAADYESGEKIFRERQANNWQSAKPLPAGAWPGFDPTRKTIAVCLPGEHFCSEWVCGWTGLLSAMLARFNVIPPFFTYSSNVYVTRSALLDAVRKAQPAPDYVLWLDDDNVLRMDQLEILIADLEAFPQAGGIAAWTLVQPKGVQELSGATLSCGLFREGPQCYPVLLDVIQSAKEAGQLIEVGYSGFPAMLMRFQTLLDAGENPFAPLASPGYGWGFMGEDAAFCYRATERGGCKWYVEPRVQLPHYKLADVGGMDIATILKKET